MPQAEFDDLPMGAVLLNDKAKIIKYNRTEGELTNRDDGAHHQASGADGLPACVGAGATHDAASAAVLSTLDTDKLPITN